MRLRGRRRRREAPPSRAPSLPDDPVLIHEGTEVVALADRQSNDIEVVLYWARRTGRVWVEVTQRTTGEIARIEATSATALDVFHHPFARAVDWPANAILEPSAGGAPA